VVTASRVEIVGIAETAVATKEAVGAAVEANKIESIKKQ
jgi:hypothetical protein